MFENDFSMWWNEWTSLIEYVQYLNGSSNLNEITKDARALCSASTYCKLFWTIFRVICAIQENNVQGPACWSCQCMTVFLVWVFLVFHWRLPIKDGKSRVGKGLFRKWWRPHVIWTYHVAVQERILCGWQWFPRMIKMYNRRISVHQILGRATGLCAQGLSWCGEDGYVHKLDYVEYRLGSSL